MPSGTPRKFTIEGIAFRLAADVNVSIMPNEFENSLVATTGAPMKKKIRRTPDAESVVLIADWSEMIVLRSYADSLDTIKFTFEWAGGDVASCEGVFNIDSFETEDNRCTIKIMPSGNWDIFAA